MSDLQKAADIFQKRGFQVKCFETANEAADYLCAAHKGTSIGMGGSVTFMQMGLYEKLIAAGNSVVSHNIVPGPDTIEMERHVKVYLTSANAVTETGEIINIDGRGNRIAQSVFGSSKVYFIVGVNKLTPDLPSGLDRAKNIASPLNARRLNKKTPCAVKADKCYDCSSPERICRSTMITTHPMTGLEAEIIFINQELGY
jgi:hypothetical protein